MEDKASGSEVTRLINLRGDETVQAKIKGDRDISDEIASAAVEHWD